MPWHMESQRQPPLSLRARAPIQPPVSMRNTDKLERTLLAACSPCDLRPSDYITFPVRDRSCMTSFGARVKLFRSSKTILGAIRSASCLASRQYAIHS